jgi:hypothetical protein
MESIQGLLKSLKLRALDNSALSPLHQLLRKRPVSNEGVVGSAAIYSKTAEHCPPDS